MKARVLIVEDSYIVSFHLQKTLETENYVVLGQCDSGEKAIDMCRNEKPDIILMDVMLNDLMDGVDAALIIKKLFDLPIIFITALSDKNTIERAKIAQPYGFLTKPFQDKEILTVIEVAIYKHQSESIVKHAEEKYRRTLQAISDAVITINNNFEITFANKATERILDIRLEDLLGKLFSDVFIFRSSATQEYVNPLQTRIEVRSRHHEMIDGIELVRSALEPVPIGDGNVHPIQVSGNRTSGLVITFRDYRERNQLIHLKNEFEKSRISSIIEGQELERSRIAKDLHDGVGQMLNAIKINVKSAIPDQGQSTKIDKLLDESIEEIKQIAENLLPSKLIDFHLPVSVKSLCAGLEEMAGIPINFTYDNEFAGLAEATRVTLYRIIQEALNNSIKHAQATIIQVTLQTQNDKLSLIIEDNGIGISVVSNQYGSHGIANMKDRVMIINGTIVIKSDPDKGTLISIEVPLTHEL